MKNNNIKATTRVCGLIGNPVGHSISPLIHNNLARICGLDLVYVTFKVDDGKVCSAVKGAYDLNILGMNVTVPHKQAVIEPLVEIDSLAQAIGAVNTLVRCEGGYKGYNTDILGLERELDDAGIKLEGRHIVILGAGGASRAIAFLCAGKGADEILILNRSVDKAQSIAEAVNGYFNKTVAVPMSISDYDKLERNDYIAIQTTSVGLYPDTEAAVIEDKEFYSRLSAGVDIIYNPAQTKFMRLVKEAGKDAYNGLKMLLYQGVAAFELWNSCTVSREMCEEVYALMKKELGISE